MSLPPHAMTSVTWESFDSLKVGSTTAAPLGFQIDGVGTRVRREGEGEEEEEEVVPPSTGETMERRPSAWLWEGT